MTRQPTIYLPHGAGPCFFMDWTMGPPGTWKRTEAWLRALPGTLPAEPAALLVVSAHWEEPQPTLLTSAAPGLRYDYSGFPPHTYELTWPAPGAPDLADRVARLLGAGGIATGGTDCRGFDHGTFIPLKVAWPTPTIPTAQLSLVSGLDPTLHLAIGRALAPLRDEGVLIVGSGMSFHNMRGFGRPAAAAASGTFDAWLEGVLAAPEGRDRALTDWTAGPQARWCHPREEHLLPLHVAAGAAGDDPGRIVFRDEVLGATVSAARFG